MVVFDNAQKLARPVPKLHLSGTTSPVVPVSLTHYFEEKTMSLGSILLLVLILMLVGVIPTWPHSRGWGYGPSGGLGLIVLIVVILLLMGRL